MARQIEVGTKSKLIRIFIQDSSSPTGAGLTGLTNASSGLVCYRSRDDDGNAAATAIALSAGTRGTWSAGGFKEKDATNQPGIYEFGLPDAAIARGSGALTLTLAGATNMVPYLEEIELIPKPLTRGTVAASPAPTTTTFSVTVPDDIATGAFDNNAQCTITRASTGAIERRKITTSTRSSATVQALTFATAFSAAPASGDLVKIE